MNIVYTVATWWSPIAKSLTTNKTYYTRSIVSHHNTHKTIVDALAAAGSLPADKGHLVMGVQLNSGKIIWESIIGDIPSCKISSIVQAFKTLVRR